MTVLVPVAISSLILTTSLAGVHLSGVVGLNPAMHSFDGATYLTVKLAADRELPKIAKPLMLGSIGVTAALVVAAVVSGHRAILLLGSIALAALIITLAAILRGDQPINRQMASWAAAGLPSDWAQIRASWERFFAVRVAMNIVAVAAVAGAVLVAR